jgi:hypothetical protein
MKKQSIVGEIVLQYLARFPEAGSRTLARKIYAEQGIAFTDEENVRTVIRYYKGQAGDSKRKSVVDKSFVTPTGGSKLGFPDSDCDPWEPFKIPARHNSGLILSDIHFPYHDVRANDAMIEYTLKINKKLNFIFINGDAIDFYGLSRFMKDPRKKNVNQELWGFAEYLTILKETFPGVKIYWKLGNHCERLEKWLFTKAIEVLDMDEWRMENLMKFRGVEDLTIIHKQIVYAGRIPIVHGHEFQAAPASPVNPARGLFLKTLSSSIVSHHHRTSAHSETDIHGKLMSWWSIGCLCGLHPEYATINKWNHGFAYIETEGLDYTFTNMKIYNGTVYRD